MEVAAFIFSYILYLQSRDRMVHMLSNTGSMHVRAAISNGL